MAVIKMAVLSQNSQEFNPKSGVLTFIGQKKDSICSRQDSKLQEAVISLSASNFKTRFL